MFLDTEEFKQRVETYDIMVKTYWRTRKEMEAMLQEHVDRTRDYLAQDAWYCVSLGGEHGVTNAQLTSVLDEVTGGNYLSQYRSIPYDLAKRKEIIGTKERRLNKAGKMQLQRVWYIPEFAPEGAGEDEGEDE